MDFENFDIYMKICMNKFCGREFTSEQYFGRDKCSSCGSRLRLKNEVREDSKQKFKDKSNSEELISDLNGFLDTLEYTPFPIGKGDRKQKAEEVD